MKQSIFNYGQIATDDFFVGRSKILNELEAGIMAAQTTILYGYRKVGKSSLIHEAVRRYKKKKSKQKVVFLYIDLTQANNSQKLISILSTSINKLIGELDFFKAKFSKLSRYISSIRPIAKMNSITGELEHSFDFSGSSTEALSSLDDCLQVLESIARKYKLIVAFDEFQHIAKWNDAEEVLWHMRSKIQLLNDITFFFSGSSRKLIEQIFMGKNSAFYRSGNLIYVENSLDLLEFKHWIKKRFHIINANIKDETIKYILDTSRCHPYYTQKLCYQICLQVDPQVSKERDIQDIHVTEAIQDIIIKEKYWYQSLIQKLSNNQENILMAMAKLKHESKDINVKNIQEETKLGKQSVNSALKALENANDQVIYKESKQYLIEDPFLELWLE